MRIVIDARWIFQEISGIGMHTRELIRNLAVVDKDNEYLLLFNDDAIRDRTIKETGLENAPNFSTHTFQHGVFSIWNQLLLPATLRSLKADIYHSTNYLIPIMAFPRDQKSEIRCVVTIHDLIPLIFPDHAPKSRKTRLFPIYKKLMTEVGKRADAIITVSNASGKDTCEYLRVPASRVTTVYNGVSTSFGAGNNGAASPCKALANMPREAKKVLYVGRCDPYKNLTILVDAMSRLQDVADSPVVLIVAGSKDSRYPEAPILATELGVQDRIIWTGYLSDSELHSLYNECDVLAHPSRYEGFGLQVLEAMASGMPVVCSNTGSLPEVAGDAAILVDPDDAQGFADAIRSLLTDETRRQKAKEAGLRQAKRFTWLQAATETLAVYNAVQKEERSE